MTTINKDLSKLDPGEVLYLWRKQIGVSQPKAAELLRLSTKAFQAAELGRSTPTHKAMTPLRAYPLPLLLRLARRRWAARASLRDVARIVGLSHVGWLRAEERADPRIVAFWAKRGFLFPDKKNDAG